MTSSTKIQTANAPKWSNTTLTHHIEQISNPVEAYNRAIELIDQHPELRQGPQAVGTQLMLTELLIKNGAYEEGMNRCMTALHHLEQHPDTAMAAKAWRYMAILQGFLGNHQQQLEYNYQSLHLVETLHDTPATLELLNNIGDTLLSLSRFEEAIDIFHSNLQHPEADARMQCVSAKNLGETYFKMGQPEKAEAIFQRALQLATEHDFLVYVSAATYYLGSIYLQQDQLTKANEHLAKAVELSIEIGQYAKERLEVYEAAMSAAMQSNEHERLSQYLPEYLQLNKEVNRKLQTRSMQRLQFRFSINEIEKERQLLSDQNRQLQAANEKIEQQKTELLAANQELRSFAHIVSHDLKEPIRTVSNFTTLLERELGDQLSPRAKTFVDFIQQASVRMTNFVSDILRYATADQAEQALTTVDCKEVLELIRLNIDAQLRETGGQLIVHDLPSIQAHSTLIMQVFQNLISNAIKFRKPEVAPIVSISGKQTADYVEFKIEDNGIGIKKEDQPRVFKLFQRLNSRTQYEGSGIGLSTVLKVLKKYNATIRLESEFGVGTSFYLKFPR